MTIQVSSLARSAERRSAAAVRTVVCVCLAVCVLPQNPVVRGYPQTKPPVETRQRFRFEVTDAASDVPVPEAEVSLIYFQKKGATEVRKEIEVKTDKNGTAKFPRLEAFRLALSVTAKGYRSHWRCLQLDGSQALVRIRLEKWAKSPK